MPDVQFIMIGPVVKIDPADLPRRPNIHWLGPKSYAELPAYMAHWDMGWMPFALNGATRYISPTKTPEFLAAGLPVVSTAIVDVVRTYGALGLVQIADADDIEERSARRSAIPRTCCATRSTPISPPCPGTRRGRACSATSRAPRNRGWKSRFAWGRERDVRLADRGRRLCRKRAGGADRLARGESVLIIDRRSHIGGNAYDCHDDAGILVHRYGPHIFHTNGQQIVDYLSQFTEWRPYEHRVLARVDGKLLPIPINLDTINRLYGLNLTSEELEKFFEANGARRWRRSGPRRTWW
jgi:UDP-galactopyranose mutase